MQKNRQHSQIVECSVEKSRRQQQLLNCGWIHFVFYTQPTTWTSLLTGQRSPVHLDQAWLIASPLNTSNFYAIFIQPLVHFGGTSFHFADASVLPWCIEVDFVHVSATWPPDPLASATWPAWFSPDIGCGCARSCPPPSWCIPYFHSAPPFFNLCSEPQPTFMRHLCSLKTMRVGCVYSIPVGSPVAVLLHFAETQMIGYLFVHSAFYKHGTWQVKEIFQRANI